MFDLGYYFYKSKVSFKFNAQGQNYIRLLFSQQGICTKNQHPRSNVLFKSKKIQNKNNKIIN